MTYSNIILIGMAGSGKTTIGRSLAKKLDLEFIDTDEQIEKVTKKPISRIFKEKGEEKFLQTEMNCILDLKLKDYVVSTGGSVVLNSGIMKHLRRDNFTVHLQCKYGTIEKRITNPEQRTVVGISEMSLREIYSFRLPLYKKYADKTVNVDGKRVYEIVNHISRSLQ